MSFKDFSLQPEIQKALDSLGFTTPTEIQAQAIPLLADKQIDFHGQAQTGTGKTLAFGIPLLQNIDRSDKSVQALIVAPTRELVGQICTAIKEVSQFMPDLRISTIYGGVSIQGQIRDLRNGVHIVVGTPGRLNDHLNKGTLKLGKLKTLVLDEADIMLDMGFKEEIDEILKYAPEHRSIWLFSATVKDGIRQIKNNHMNNPVDVRISQKTIGTQNTKQYFCIVGRRDRVAAISRFIDSVKDFYGFIFTPTKLLAAEVSEHLAKRGYAAQALHGDMNQPLRNKVIKQFKDRSFSILVATDVAARGIDVSDLTHVINFSVPEDQESYVHRVGRTGRAGKEGVAITFASARELRVIKQIQHKFKVEIEAIDVPSLEAIAQVRVDQARDYLQEVTGDIADSQYYKKLIDVVHDLSQDELKHALASFLNEKFFKYLHADKTIVFKPAHQVDLDTIDDQMHEMYITVGSDDGLSNQDIIQFIKQHAGNVTEHIEKIKVIKRRTYIAANGQIINQLMDSLRLKTLGGRKVMTQISDDHQPRQPRGGRRPQPRRRMNNSRSEGRSRRY